MSYVIRSKTIWATEDLPGQELRRSTAVVNVRLRPRLVVEGLPSTSLAAESNPDVLLHLQAESFLFLTKADQRGWEGVPCHAVLKNRQTFQVQ